jgi:Domain of unknown function (DUF4410)
MWPSGMISRMNYRSSLSAILLIPTVLLSGCSSISVLKEKQNPNIAFQAPTKIYVRDFTGDQKIFRVDRKEDSLVEFQKKTANQLSEDLVKKLNDCVLPAERLKGSSQMPKGNAWIVEGNFDRVNQGSRMMRILIGMGAGGTKIETTVRILSLGKGRPQEILTFKTSGGSNMEPGPGLLCGPPDPTDFITTPLWATAMTGLTKDTTRTAKEIAAEISDYLQKHGVQPKDPKLKVKRMRGDRA